MYENFAALGTERCIGCGLCVSTCPTGGADTGAQAPGGAAAGASRYGSEHAGVEPRAGQDEHRQADRIGGPVDRGPVAGAALGFEVWARSPGRRA